eukprot:1136341-Pelagomonas_calceolata.AAC.1
MECWNLQLIHHFNGQQRRTWKLIFFSIDVLKCSVAQTNKSSSQTNSLKGQITVIRDNVTSTVQVAKEKGILCTYIYSSSSSSSLECCLSLPGHFQPLSW